MGSLQDLQLLHSRQPSYHPHIQDKPLAPAPQSSSFQPCSRTPTLPSSQSLNKVPPVLTAVLKVVAMPPTAHSSRSRRHSPCAGCSRPMSA
ncbi:hypothetical protein PENSPDRAFT_81575 [Peniophora sp. CONT]|nr:hypothetical protein PENSPDRAFT_81575 [Peniophora sp. CONT]